MSESGLRSWSCSAPPGDWLNSTWDPFNNVAALGISTVKMLLVVLFFMHVRYEPKLTWIFAIAGLVWFLIMVDLTLSDYSTRGDVRRYQQKLAAHRTDGTQEPLRPSTKSTHSVRHIQRRVPVFKICGMLRG